MAKFWNKLLKQLHNCGEQPKILPPNLAASHNQKNENLLHRTHENGKL